jgi:hypothetical protein
MSGPGKLYRVLRDGIHQRSGNAWKRPSIGDLVNVSDEMGPRLVAAGYAELASAPAATIPPVETPAPEPPAESSAAVEPGHCPEHPRYQGRGEPRKGCEACARVHAESHSPEVAQ